jgi:hypothetical protein
MSRWGSALSRSTLLSGQTGSRRHRPRPTLRAKDTDRVQTAFGSGLGPVFEPSASRHPRPATQISTPGLLCPRAAAVPDDRIGDEAMTGANVLAPIARSAARVTPLARSTPLLKATGHPCLRARAGIALQRLVWLRRPSPAGGPFVLRAAARPPLDTAATLAAAADPASAGRSRAGASCGASQERADSVPIRSSQGRRHAQDGRAGRRAGLYR